MQIHRNPFFIGLISGLFVVSFPAEATIPDEELTLLPPVCHAVWKGDAAIRKNYVQRLGIETWRPMGHYCNGLNNINKARLAANKAARKRFLEASLNEFRYCFGQWPANSPMIPEAQNKKAEVEAMLRFIN